MNKKLSQEIKRMVKKDQVSRNKVGVFQGNRAAWERVKAIDRANTKRIKQIVRTNGWPTFDMVGEESAHGFWLLVQHADADRRFQKKCLDLMALAIKAEQASKKDFAYLTDRVLVGTGKSQKYGTQFHRVDGMLVPRPISAKKGLEARRKKVGLESFKKYKKKMEKIGKSTVAMKKRVAPRKNKR